MAELRKLLDDGRTFLRGLLQLVQAMAQNAFRAYESTIESLRISAKLKPLAKFAEDFFQTYKIRCKEDAELQWHTFAAKYSQEEVNVVLQQCGRGGEEYDLHEEEEDLEGESPTQQQ